MIGSRRVRRTAAALVVVGALGASSSASALIGEQTGPPGASIRLPLGPADLPELRNVEDLGPGATLTTIHRGYSSPDDHWTINVGIPVPPTQLVRAAEELPSPTPEGQLTGTWAPGTTPKDVPLQRKLGAVPLQRRLQAGIPQAGIPEVAPETLSPTPQPPEQTLGQAVEGQLLWVAEREKVQTLGSPTDALRLVGQLSRRGFNARLERVDDPAKPDRASGALGHLVRVGHYPNRAAAEVDAERLTQAGFQPSVVYTAYDGAPVAGPWVVRVLTINPATFEGSVRSTVGTSVAGAETASAMGRTVEALAAINGGFFNSDPNEGIPGEPTGVSIVDGMLLSEATNGRAALLLGKDGRHPVIDTFSTSLSLRVGNGEAITLDGINRVPGKIPHCGGVGGDVPATKPQHDVTCTDPNETVVLTSDLGTEPPRGPGIEAVLDPYGRVLVVRPRTGQPIPKKGAVIQAIGTDAEWLAQHVHVGQWLQLRSLVRDSGGRRVALGAGDYLVNGGSRLVHGGQIEVNAAEAGLRPDEPSFYYGAAITRQARTMAGVDRDGRLILVTVDGAQAGLSVGLSMVEAAQVMQSLGAVDALSLDGGDSTAMSIRGRLVSSPSGSAGERQIGDAIVVVPDLPRAESEPTPANSPPGAAVTIE